MGKKVCRRNISFTTIYVVKVGDEYTTVFFPHLLVKTSYEKHFECYLRQLRSNGYTSFDCRFFRYSFYAVVTFKSKVNSNSPK